MKNVFLPLIFAVIGALSTTAANANQMIVKKGVVFMTSDDSFTVAADSSGGLSCVFSGGSFKAGNTAGPISVPVHGAKFLEFNNDQLYVATSKQGVAGFEKFDVSACLSQRDDNADDPNNIRADVKPGFGTGPCALVSTMPAALKGTCKPGEL